MNANYNQALNDLAIGIISLDKQLQIRAVNQGLTDLTGYSETELIGRSWHFLFGADSDSSQLQAIQTALANQQPYQATVLSNHKDGRNFWNQLTIKPLEKEQQQTCLIICQDVSDRIKLESELSTANQQAQAAREFLATMSHEIRTPMTGVLGLTELALHKTMPDEVRDYLQKIKLSSNNLLRIVNNILDFSKLEAEMLSIENQPVNLKQLLTEIHDTFIANCQAKHLDLTLVLPPDLPNTVLADEQRLRQILINLVANALKFTQAGKIEISAQVLTSNPQHAQLRFSITDSGIGISAANQTKLLAPFTQADDSISRRFGGTGLGLSICQKLLKLMNSQLQIDSVLHQGSRFSFEIGLAISQKPLNNNRRRGKRLGGAVSPFLRKKGQQLRNKRILIAEDNAINQQVIYEFLALCGIEPVMTNNGEQAIQQLETQEFDAILMDINMPIMDGITATKQIRQFSQIPIIALSAGVSEHERQQCLAAGVSDFASKPVIADELIERLLKHCTTKIKNTKPRTIQFAGYNFQSLLKLLGGNQALLFGLLQEFQKDSALQVEEIQQAYQQQDYNQIQKRLHVLLGSSGTIGAEKFYNAVAQYQSCLQQKQPDQHQHQAFLKAYQITTQELAEILKSAEQIQSIDDIEIVTKPV